MLYSRRLFSFGVLFAFFLGTLSEAGTPLPATAFFNQADSHPAIDLIQAANTSIDIEIYEMTDPAIRAALRAAIARPRQVKLRIVHEEKPVGTACTVFAPINSTDSADCNDLRGFVHEVQRAGGKFVPFSKSQLCGQVGTRCFEHGKMMIVDQKKVLVSTGNLNPTSLCNRAQSPSRCNRDYSVISQDSEVIQTLQQVFEKDLAGNAYNLRAIITPHLEEKLTVSPFSLAPLVAFIKSARTSILVQNQYLKEPEINAALMDAARAGLNVQIMTESVCAFAQPTPQAAQLWGQTYSAFDASGVKSRIFNASMSVDGIPGYLHAKAIVVDGTRGWIGSVNGSVTATSNNREFGLFLSDAKSVRALNQIITQDFSNPASESWQESAVCAKDRRAHSIVQPGEGQDP